MPDRSPPSFRGWRIASPIRFRPEATGPAASNYRNLLMDALWIGVFNGLVGTFTTVFVIRLGAPDFYIGLLVSGPALVTALVAMPSARLVQRLSERRVQIAAWGRIFVHLAFLSIAFLPFFLSHHSTALATTILVILSSLPGGLLNVAITSIIASVTEPESRSRVIGVRFAVMGATSALSVMAGGKLLDLIRPPLNYQALFVVASLCAFVSIYYFARLEIPEDKLLSEWGPAHPAGRGLDRLRESMAELREHRAFLYYALAYLVYHLGIFGAHPLFSLYLVRYLGLSDTSVGLLSTVNTFFTLLAYFPWGHYADRRGNRVILLAGSFGVALFPIIIALSKSLPPLLLLHAFSGIFVAALNIAAFNVLLEVTPEQGRAPLLAFHTVIHNASAFAGPLVITSISQTYGVVLLLFITGAVRVLGAAMFALVPLARPSRG